MQTITRAYRTALRPTPTQELQLQAITRAVRYVYNAALDQRMQLWSRFRARISAFDQMKELTAALADPDLAWLKEAPRSSLNAAIQNLDRGYAAFFRRIKQGGPAGHPKFHSRFHRGGFKLFTSCRVVADAAGESVAVVLPKIGAVRLHEHGYIPVGTLSIRSGSVTYDGHRWYVSLTVDEEQATPTPGTRTLYVHLGLRALAYISDSEEPWRMRTVENPQHIEQYDRLLQLRQRRLSRRQKGSSSREEARRQVARLHERIASARSDALHKLTSSLVRESNVGCIVIQQWDIVPMMQDAALARRIADAAWGELTRQLTYKATWAGVAVVVVPPEEPVSKRCSACGALHAELGASRTFRCPSCGHMQDRERNALANLRAYNARLRQQAVAESVA